MSRHRSAYTEDDLYDYYDDDYDDDGYVAKPKPKPAATKPAGKGGKGGPKATVAGGGVKTGHQAASKTTPGSGISMAASAKKETHSIVASNKEASVANNARTNTKEEEDSLAFSAEKLSIRLTEQKREEAQRVQDIDFMGFGEEAAKVEVVKGSVWTITEQEALVKAAQERSLLLADSAPLSDDEFDVVSSASDSLGVKQSGGVVSGSESKHMTMVVAGHVDAGKSTLVGHMLHKTGKVAQRTVQKYQKESAQQGKGSFALAWVMDDTAAERAHGVTIDIAERQMNTASKIITILDAPGHRDFIPNMISGATFADAALLVIPASVGEYESSMGERAQTREHAVLLKALGVVQIIVVINKMDMTSPAWCQDRFESIKHTISTMLSDLQFSLEKNVRFIPVAGLSGENLSEISVDNTALRAWYSGPTLLDSIDSFRNPMRFVNKPLRAIVTAVVTVKDKTVTVRANVQQGRLRSGRGVSLTSANGCATIRSIVTDDGTSIPELVAGQAGTIVLVDRSGRSGQEMSLTNGMILCKGPPLAPLTWRFRANILTMAGINTPILPGSVFDLFLHGEELQCKINKLVSMRVAATGGAAGVVTKLNPKCIPGTRSAVVIIETLERKVCIETLKECKGLGRFALRARGATLAVGVCEQVLKLDMFE